MVNYCVFEFKFLSLSTWSKNIDMSHTPLSTQSFKFFKKCMSHHLLAQNVQKWPKYDESFEKFFYKIPRHKIGTTKVGGIITFFGLQKNL